MITVNIDIENIVPLFTHSVYGDHSETNFLNDGVMREYIENNIRRHLGA